MRAALLSVVVLATASACADQTVDLGEPAAAAPADEPIPSEELIVPETTPPTSDTTAPDAGAEPSVTAAADQAPDPTVAAPTPTTAPATTAAATSCTRVTDFENADGWAIVNDGVMGGRSLGSASASASVLRFEGTVVTDGGGFTSIRRRLNGGELVDSDRVEMRIRADDRIYGIVLDDLHEFNGRNVSYRADIDTSTPTADDDGWVVVSIAHADLVPTIFGRVVDAPPFEPDEATEIGIIIADGRDGEFVLDIDWIDACGLDT